MTTAPERPPGPMAPDTLLDPRTLLTDRQFASVVTTILDNNPGMTENMAERITTEGLRFTVTAALTPGHAMAPSRIVDEGWHSLILHTELYAELCGVFGRFVHHSPGYSPDHYDGDVLEATQAAIRAAGFEVDAELWRAPDDESLVAVAANCQHAPAGDGPVKPMPTPQPPCHNK
ncbi:glycine-rich domain-containing protein [Kitasatospora sp. NPDC051853]|uniref:glycine-rich domain-containing protein n=1 Tax=Kitasatospora sp. NPDC051853 TaxID=3364058 RepID=UPI00379A23FB